MDESQILTETLEKIDKYIITQQEAIIKGEKLDRLMKNNDFIDVVLNGYFEAEAQKLFNILIDPSEATPYTDEQIQIKLSSIRDFKRYVGTDDYSGTIKIEASQAPGNITSNELERKRVTAEAGEE